MESVTNAIEHRKQAIFTPLSIFLALRYVRNRHANGFSAFISASSTIGIALGTMVLIIALSTMNGFERELAHKLLSIVPHAELISVKSPIKNWTQSVKQVEQNPNVIAAAPVIKLTGMMQHKTKLKAVEIRGVDIDLETRVSDIESYMVQGSWYDLSNNYNNNVSKKLIDNGIVIGSGVAKNLALALGDTVQILLPPSDKKTISNNTNLFTAPVKRQVKIVGIFKFGGMLDETLAYISLAHAVDIKGYKKGEAQGIRINIDDVFSAPNVARSVAYNFNHYVYIMDWTRTQGHLFNDIQLVRMVMFIVLALVIAVASFNIVSTLIMVVNEKKGDIAILKTMGANSRLIMMVFICQGLVNGVLGTTVGSILGYIVSFNLAEIVAFFESILNLKLLSADVYFIDHIPSQLLMTDVYVTVSIALIMSLTATIYPAWQATKTEPSQVLGQL